VTAMIRQHRDSVSYGLLAIALALLAALLAPAFGHAAAGDLDRSFGGDGKVSTDFGSPNDGATSVAIDSQGRLVAAGSGNNSCCVGSLIARYNQNGSLDSSFSGDGKVITDFDTNYSRAAIDSQDRIVVASGICNYEYSHCDFALRRYDPDGKLDLSFSGDGKVTTNIGGYGWATSVAIDPQGRIIAAGGKGRYKGHIALARYTPNGDLDLSFSGDGVLVARQGVLGHSIRAWPPFGMAIGPAGGIVIAGYAENETDLRDFALVRYNPNGTVNGRFGEVRTDFGGADRAASAAIDPRGRIVAAGHTRGSSVGNGFALARYNPNGSLDGSFSGDGKVTTRFTISADQGDEAEGVVIDSRGRIVAAGHNDYKGFALARYNPDGSLDSSFGKVTTAFPDSPAGNGANSVAIDSQGRIVAAGLGGGDLALARYIGYP
jgi:uncharacterized delta-60 repeat protein